MRHHGPRLGHMPLVQHLTEELHLKIVYYGPGLGGKTSNLEFIHQTARPEARGKLVSLVTEAERTLFFDLLPMELGVFRGYRLRLHLCTVPGQMAMDRTRQLVLRGVDGVVFVVDSQPERIDSNIESMLNLEANLRLQGDDPLQIPQVVQYNKRDLWTAMSIEELRTALSIPLGTPEFEASAATGYGVFETLKAVTKLCLNRVGNPRSLPEGRSRFAPPNEGYYPEQEERRAESGFFTKGRMHTAAAARLAARRVR